MTLAASVTVDTLAAKAEIVLNIHDGMGLAYRRRSLEYLGLLDRGLSTVLTKLLSLAVHLESFILSGEPTASGKSYLSARSRRVQVVVYGFRKDAKNIGALLSENEVFLQHPDPHLWDRSVIYDNPQYLKRPGAEIVVPGNTGSAPPLGQKTKQSNIEQEQVDEIFGFAQGPQNYSKVESSLRLATALMRCVPTYSHPAILSWPPYRNTFCQPPRKGSCNASRKGER